MVKQLSWSTTTCFAAGLVVAATVSGGVPEEACDDPAAGAPASARLRARRAARHALARGALQAQEGGQRRHQGRCEQRFVRQRPIQHFCHDNCSETQWPFNASNVAMYF